MIGGSPMYLFNPMSAPAMSYDPRLVQQRPVQGQAPAVPPLSRPVYRGAMGKEKPAPPRRTPLAIPTPEELGVAAVHKARTAVQIPTPEELGLAGK
jgi:hypothetical protein